VNELFVIAAAPPIATPDVELMLWFTIAASDVPSAGRCSRCGAQLGERVLAAEWQGVEYCYCDACRVKIEAAARRNGALVGEARRG
jgi:hypothetical protein